MGIAMSGDKFSDTSEDYGEPPKKEAQVSVAINAPKYRSIDEIMKPKVIKHNDLNFESLDFDSEKAVAEFRAAYPLLNLHSERVNDKSALAVMLEIVENLKSNLHKREKMLN